MATLLRRLMHTVTYELGTGRAIANTRRDDEVEARAIAEVDALAWRLLPVATLAERAAA